MFKVIPSVIGFGLTFVINLFSVILEVAQEYLILIGQPPHLVVSN